MRSGPRSPGGNYHLAPALARALAETALVRLARGTAGEAVRLMGEASAVARGFVATAPADVFAELLPPWLFLVSGGLAAPDDVGERLAAAALSALDQRKRVGLNRDIPAPLRDRLERFLRAAGARDRLRVLCDRLRGLWA